jgi:hypothetical protein
MYSEMANIAAECVRKPRTTSVWSSQLDRYVCADTSEGRAAVADMTDRTQVAHPPINRTFKFVFLCAFFGTLAFLGLCIGLSLAAGREPPPLFEKTIMASFDLAKIAVGSTLGLLGGKYLQAGPADTAVS